MGIADRGKDSGGLAGRRNCGPRSALALGSKGGISLRPGSRMERGAWLLRCTSSSIRSRNTIRVRGVDRHRLSSCFPLYQGGFIIKRDDNACCFQGKPDGRTLGRVWTATVERRGLKPLLPALEPEFVPSSSPSHNACRKSTTWFSSSSSPPSWRPQGMFLPCTPDS